VCKPCIVCVSERMSERLIVSVEQGDLRGRAVITKSGLHYYSFQGIPYAKPPVGNLRFKVSYNSTSFLHFEVIRTKFIRKLSVISNMSESFERLNKNRQLSQMYKC
jgi:hypothetical protein